MIKGAEHSVSMEERPLTDRVSSKWFLTSVSRKQLLPVLYPETAALAQNGP